MFVSHVHHKLILFFFFNDTATTEIYTLSLHDALSDLPQIRTTNLRGGKRSPLKWRLPRGFAPRNGGDCFGPPGRSEEHTSELQSQSNLVCRLLLEKKKSDRSQPARQRAHGPALSAAPG